MPSKTNQEAVHIKMSDISALPPLSWSSVSFIADPPLRPLAVDSRILSSFVTDDDAVYDNYVTTTNNPGNTLFIIALIICLGSLVALPVAVKIGRARQRRHLNQQLENSEERHPDEDHLSLYQRLNRSVLNFTVDSIFLWRNARSEPHVTHAIAIERLHSTLDPTSESVERPPCEDGQNVEVSLHGQNMPTQSNCEMELNHSHAENDHGMSRRETLCTYPLTIFTYDKESKRILKLAVPFMLNNIIKTMGDLLLLAIVSQYLGTDSMIAFAMVGVIVGVSSSFMMGWVQAINSVGAMAHGAENYQLLGQYVQAAVLIYLIFQVPLALIWGFSMHDILLLFGFDEATASIARDFSWVYSAQFAMEGVFLGFTYLLGIIDREKSAMVFACLSVVFEVGLVAITVTSLEDTSLVIVGLVVLTNKCLFVFLIILVSSWKGWIRPYEYGMIGELSLLNRDVVKVMFKTGTPLAVGGLLAYAEWEILTIFAAVLGPAEVATWAILGFVWDVFESTTEAIGDAAEVRCAYQLGRGRPETAKMSAYKSLTLTLVVSSLMTATFLLLDDYLPSLLTTDPTIQGMLLELFPLMGLGNMTMTVGMVCWALIGSQGRYQLVTTIVVACSLLITVPLGAITTVWLRIDLQGLTFSVVVGYVLIALFLTIIIMLSDWDEISKKIIESVANGELEIEGSSIGSNFCLPYDGIDWDKLPADVRAAAVKLGYSKDLWDNREAPNELLLSWTELNSDQMEAAILLGYDELQWIGGDGVDERIDNSTSNNAYDLVATGSPRNRYNDTPRSFNLGQDKDAASHSQAVNEAEIN